jgi:hypothetical protein
MATAKLIKSTGVSKNDPIGKWYNLEDIVPFIQGVVTGDLDESQISSTLITGVPTPWARAKIFSFAFQYVTSKDPNIQQSGLINFFKGLVNEWKGLLALVALYSDRVRFSEPVYMNPNSNLYDLAGGFGRMLLDDADIWTDQQKAQTNKDELPYIQLIRYNGKVIGGTSPFSIVFPGVEYSNLKSEMSDIPWYRNGKFENPMSNLDDDKLQKLYLFINNIIGVIYQDKNGDQIARPGTIVGFKQNVNLSRQNNPLDLKGLEKMLSQWQDDIKRKKNNLQINGTVAKYPNLAMPYKALLDSHQKVYQLQDGSFTFDEPNDKLLIKATLSDLQNILKDDKSILGWNESNDIKNPLSQAAVYYLRVNDVRDKDHPIKYFALPLSMEGIQMFTQQLGRLVSHQDPKFDIIGKISDQGNLIVDLTVNIDNQPYRLNSKEYEIEWGTQNSKVIMWPDFVSDNWDAYYLYSEYPLNIQGVKFVPFYKRGQEQKIITVERPSGLETTKKVAYCNSPKDEIKDGELDITNLIAYPAGQVSPDKHKYEVIKSNRPIAGLEIRIENAGKFINGGYLMIKDPEDTSMGSRKIKDYTNQVPNKDAIVGIDFGSNNSCIQYTLTTTSNSEVDPIKFVNRRLALVGIDATSGATAQRDELLFFSNEPALNGQIKSWLHEHDVQYIGANSEKEIAGGVPVNEKNILVKEMDKYKINTQAGILHYNMKWLSDEEGLAKKTAYLKALWLSICADLYAEKHAPAELHWSYPGSMTGADKNVYYDIYNIHLPNIIPIKIGSSQLQLNEIVDQTESESVCKYALSKEKGLTSTNMFIGIDVGGSTSDILLLAKDITQNNIPRLYKQSSVRIAAGVFFGAVIKSEKFRKAIFDFHEGQKRIRVENIKDILTAKEKAPFYLNSVFDQLEGNDFREFYAKIKSAAPFVYAIPAYVTGLLVFYSGKLCAKTVKEHNLTLTEVQLLPFGKGGRLFHWIETLPGYPDYYKMCFSKGYGQGSEAIQLKYRNDIKDDNKSEVAKGLAVTVPIAEFDKELRESSDIWAEKGVRYLQNGQFITLEEDGKVESEYFQNIGQFELPDKFENFEDFLRIFIDFVGYKAGLVKDIVVLEEKTKELKDYMSNFFTNDAEYTKAVIAKQKYPKFEYRYPMLLAEGACYLEQILIPEIFKS